jgi:hypothetical protein
MAIGSVVFGITIMEMRGNVLCHASLMKGIIVFRRATLAIPGVVVYCAAMAL